MNLSGDIEQLRQSAEQLRERTAEAVEEKRVGGIFKEELLTRADTAEQDLKKLQARWADVTVQISLEGVDVGLETSDN